MEHNLSIAKGERDALHSMLLRIEDRFNELNDELQRLIADPDEDLDWVFMLTYCSVVNYRKYLETAYDTHCDWIFRTEKYVAAMKLQLS
jgi:hypothetical protein